jgi:hypothetical protein
MYIYEHIYLNIYAYLIYLDLYLFYDIKLSSTDPHTIVLVLPNYFIIDNKFIGYDSQWLLIEDEYIKYKSSSLNIYIDKIWMYYILIIYINNN